MTEFTVPKGYALTGHCDLTYENSSRFLKQYCGNCATEKCGIQESMRSAMGNNYPYGHGSLAVVRKSHFLEEDTTPDDGLTGLVVNLDALRSIDEMVICAEYKDPQLEFSFAVNE